MFAMFWLNYLCILYQARINNTIDTCYNAVLLQFIKLPKKYIRLNFNVFSMHF
jgi:hypothetical protein